MASQNFENTLFDTTFTDEAGNVQELFPMPPQQQSQPFQEFQVMEEQSQPFKKIQILDNGVTFEIQVPVVASENNLPNASFQQLASQNSSAPVVAPQCTLPNSNLQNLDSQSSMKNEDFKAVPQTMASGKQVRKKITMPLDPTLFEVEVKREPGLKPYK